MTYPGEYTEAVYLYMANERILSKTYGVSDKRRSRIKKNNTIIKSNVNKACGPNSFQNIYGNISENKEARMLDYRFKIDSVESSGESVMRDKLAELGLTYYQEVIFDDLPYLRYDFFLPYNNTVIEVDGIQHIEFNKEYHETVKDFERQKRNDNKKRKFAYKNNVIYVRFRYNELGEIEEKLRKNFVIK